MGGSVDRVVFTIFKSMRYSRPEKIYPNRMTCGTAVRILIPE